MTRIEAEVRAAQTHAYNRGYENAYRLATYATRETEATLVEQLLRSLPHTKTVDAAIDAFLTEHADYAKRINDATQRRELKEAASKTDNIAA